MPINSIDLVTLPSRSAEASTIAGREQHQIQHMADSGATILEKEILLAQIQNDPKESQKPEKVIQGMITGRIKKELKEICLLDQVYVKAEDGKQTVAKYVEEVAKANGAKIAIKGFVRFETGEGIEKRQDDFAAEVAAQVAGK